ncbi:hypothetical protein J437_LFUL006257 [Ladona fulva]|uniref:C2H2-type domain-containing protein n=1 Tax=Ladona fulva TaxID=123851 RepID=A0A8K0P0M2_LADFU|nr:hypothetical protein J437_LFUL006257 [Ladona fulva]
MAMDCACSEKQNPDPLVNYKKSKLKEHAEREDFSGIVGNINGEVTAKVDQILVNSVKTKKRKEKCAKRENFSGISDDFRTGFRDVEVEQIFNDSVKVKKSKKKRTEIEAFSGIVGGLEKNVKDGEVTAEVEQIFNDSVKMKKRKKKRTEREDFSGISDDLGKSLRDVEVEQMLNDSVKTKKIKKHREREDFSGIDDALETSIGENEVTVKVKKKLNNYVKIKKRKEKYAEGEDFSGINDDLGTSVRDIEAEQILNDSVKIKKRKKREESPGFVGDLETSARGDEVTVKRKQDVNDSGKVEQKNKYTEREELAEIDVDVRTSVSDGEVTAKGLQEVSGSGKIKKQKKKLTERVDISQIDGELETSVRNCEMNAKVEENLNVSVTPGMVDRGDLKRKKEKTKMRSDGEACKTTSCMLSQPQKNWNSLIEQYTDPLGMDYINCKKKIKRERKCKEIGSIECGHSIWHNSGNSDEYLPESAAIESVNLLSSELRESKGKYKNVAGEICNTSLLADKENPPGEVTDMNGDIVADVENVKQKKGKQSDLSSCQDKEMYSNSPFFSNGIDKLCSSGPKLNNFQSVFELGHSDAVKTDLIAKLLDDVKKDLITSPTHCDKSEYDIPKNTEYGNQQEIDGVVYEKVKKTKSKKLLKMKKYSVKVEHNAESDHLLSSKEVRVDKINSTMHLQDGSSNLDETLTGENVYNPSSIIESNTNSPLRQESAHVFDEEEKDRDVDRGIRRSTRGKFSERINFGAVDKSKASHPLEDGNSVCELDNENSPSDPFRRCQTTMQTTSVKDSKKKKCYFACDECNRVYTRKDNLAIHKKVKHECVPMFKCSDCGKSFTYKHVLRDHILRIHGDVVTFDCELCNYKAKKELDLKRHVMAMHEAMATEHKELLDFGVIKHAMKLYKGKWDKEAKNAATAEVEVREVTPSVFPCSMCGCSFKCESNLRRHMKIVHFKQTDFVCAFCGKFFSQAFNLKLHMKNIHSEKNITCMICECKFENRQKLSMHLLGHAPKVGFNCQYCDYVLVSESDNRMKRHIKEKHLDMENIHSEKTCMICEREFENVKKLRKHLLGHAPKVGFNCQYCDYVLVSKSDNRMGRHITEKHLDVEEGSSRRKPVKM